MQRIIFKILSNVYFYILGFPKSVIRLLRNRKLYDPKETYYAGQKQKSELGIIIDQVRHILKWRCPEQYYFLYGFDVMPYKKQEEYLDYGFFMRRRDYLNNNPNRREKYSYTGIFRDKFYFSIFMEKLGFRVPKTIGLMEKGNIYLLSDNKYSPLDALLDKPGKYICKPLDGIGGVGIITLDVTEKGEILYNKELIDNSAFWKKIEGKRYFIQERITEQHHKMSLLYDKSINTLRITTVRNPQNGDIEVIGCMLLMGARNAIVSNWHYGGVIINVNNEGRLDKYGYSLYDKRIISHPETKVVFESFKIPYFDLALSEAKRCHSLFYGVHSVGWDFAILPDGIMFIEGNDNWGMAAHQMVSGGLTEKFKKYFQ